MTPQRPFFRTLAVAAVCVALAGCVSLLPKSKPAQMYRFGVIDVAATAAPASTVSIAKGRTGFPAAAAGDRILTATGSETAFIAEARWVAPAAILFDDALERAFDARAGGPRLLTRGDALTSGLNLRVDVDTFEARYLNGPDAAPTVVVSMRATLVRLKDRAVMGEKVFQAQRRASDNRVGAIVEGYDAAVKETLGQLAEWTAGTAGSGV